MVAVNGCSAICSPVAPGHIPSKSQLVHKMNEAPPLEAEEQQIEKQNTQLAGTDFAYQPAAGCV